MTPITSLRMPSAPKGPRLASAGNSQEGYRQSVRGARMTDASAPPQGLLRVLGLVFGLAVVVGGVIGSGIMRAPGIIAQAFTTTPLILFAWLVGGLVAMLSAMPLVEA